MRLERDADVPRQNAYAQVFTDGIAAVARVRRGAGARRLKVIFNIAFATGDFWARALAAGADRCLPGALRGEDFASVLEDLAGYPD